jgi:hypothetical protein
MTNEINIRTAYSTAASDDWDKEQRTYDKKFNAENSPTQVLEAAPAMKTLPNTNFEQLIAEAVERSVNNALAKLSSRADTLETSNTDNNVKVPSKNPPKATKSTNELKSEAVADILVDWLNYRKQDANEFYCTSSYIRNSMKRIYSSTKNSDIKKLLERNIGKFGLAVYTATDALKDRGYTLEGITYNSAERLWKITR